MANSGLPYPIRCRAGKARQLELPGVPLGSFPSSTYDELTLDLAAGDVYIFFSDGASEANDALGREFGVERLLRIARETCQKSAKEIVDAIFTAVQDFRGETPPNDDTTVVVVRITA